MTSAPVTASQCPQPPADFSSRSIPIYELNLSAAALYRIHRTAFGPLFFNRRSTNSTVFRFDAAYGEFGVLYASPSFSACMVETVIRDSFEKGSLPLLIDQRDLDSRSISSLGLATPRAVRLADFTQPLFKLGGNGQIMTVGDYRIPNLWSSAIHAHPDNLDGIYFRSRFANEVCVAIFDRVELVIRGTPVPLTAFPELGPFLDKYNIGII